MVLIETGGVGGVGCAEDNGLVETMDGWMDNNRIALILRQSADKRQPPYKVMIVGHVFANLFRDAPILG